MPVRMPGSMINGGTSKCRSAMSRSEAVTGGTTDEMAIPLISAVPSSPCRPRNWRRRRASWSEVRSATVTIRQWSTRSLSRNSPMTVWVLPTSMASSTGRLLQVESEVEDGRRVGERPYGDQIGSGRGIGGHASEVDAPGHLDRDGCPQDPGRLGHLLGGHVVEEDEVGRRRFGLTHLLEGVALHLHDDAGPPLPGPGHGVGDGGDPQVVVLDEDAVGEAPAV